MPPRGEDPGDMTVTGPSGASTPTARGGEPRAATTRIDEAGRRVLGHGTAGAVRGRLRPKSRGDRRRVPDRRGSCRAAARIAKPRTPRPVRPASAAEKACSRRGCVRYAAPVRSRKSHPPVVEEASMRTFAARGLALAAVIGLVAACSFHRGRRRRPRRGAGRRHGRDDQDRRRLRADRRRVRPRPAGGERRQAGGRRDQQGRRRARQPDRLHRARQPVQDGRHRPDGQAVRRAGQGPADGRLHRHRLGARVRPDVPDRPRSRSSRSARRRPRSRPRSAT